MDVDSGTYMVGNLIAEGKRTDPYAFTIVLGSIVTRDGGVSCFAGYRILQHDDRYNWFDGYVSGIAAAGDVFVASAKK